MTTIVMVKTEGDVLIAYDSRLTGGDKVESPDHKVFVNNGVIYGMAGSVLYSNVTRYADLPQPNDMEPAKWLTFELIPELRDLFKDVEMDDTKRSLEMLIVIHGEIFEISSRLAWNRNTDGQYAIGSGAYFAIGAMSAGALVKCAVTIAAKHDECTGDQIHVTTAGKMLADAE